MSLSAALLARDVSALPSRRDEAWRWTDLRSLIPALPSELPILSVPAGAGPFVAEDSLIVVNGRGPGRLDIAPGENRTVVLRFISATEGTAHVAQVCVTLGEGARLTLLESHEGQAKSYIASAALEIRLGRGAQLERIVLMIDDADAISTVEARAALAPGARFHQTLVTQGSRRQRLETHVQHPGGGAEVRLDGLYWLGSSDAHTHADLTSEVTHARPGGVTDQMTKGVADGASRAVFQGKIRVDAGADQTDARMGHHALILSDRAEVDAKPELEIWADDVACTHGNTVGALDEAALFYARQRGLSEAQARAMLTTAFLGEVIDRIDHRAARTVVRHWLDARGLS